MDDKNEKRGKYENIVDVLSKIHMEYWSLSVDIVTTDIRVLLNPCFFFWLETTQRFIDRKKVQKKDEESSCQRVLLNPCYKGHVIKSMFTGSITCVGFSYVSRHLIFHNSKF